MTSLICSLQKLPRANKVSTYIIVLTRIRNVLLKEVSVILTWETFFFRLVCTMLVDELDSVWMKVYWKIHSYLQMGICSSGVELPKMCSVDIRVSAPSVLTDPLLLHCPACWHRCSLNWQHFESETWHKSIILGAEDVIISVFRMVSGQILLFLPLYLCDCCNIHTD